MRRFLLLIAVVLITGALVTVSAGVRAVRGADPRLSGQPRDPETTATSGSPRSSPTTSAPTSDRGIFREIPTRFPYDDEHDRVYPIEDVTVTATPESTPTDVQVTTEGNVTRIRIGDPDVFITGQHTYTISYTVQGALNGFEDHDELFWNTIGTEWPVPIEQAQTTVTAPAAILDVLCFTGPPGGTLPCTSSNVDGTTARFTEDGLNPFEALTVVVGFPTGAVPTPVPILEEKLTFSTAFDPAPGKIAVGVGALVLGVVGLVWLLRKGRDRRFVGSTTDQAFGNITGEEEAVPLRGRVTSPVEFEPPEGIRPGQLGTLIDEEANLLDITATIVDLAGARLHPDPGGAERGRQAAQARLPPHRSWQIRGPSCVPTRASSSAICSRPVRSSICRSSSTSSRRSSADSRPRSTTTPSRKAGSRIAPTRCACCGEGSASSSSSPADSSRSSPHRKVGGSPRSGCRSSGCCC